MNTSFDPPDPALWPTWATGLANGCVQPGAQLCTRDGRAMGNAVVIGEKVERYGVQFWPICTDAGTKTLMTDKEIADQFWPPEWLKDSRQPHAVPQHLVALSSRASPD